MRDRIERWWIAGEFVGSVRVAAVLLAWAVLLGALVHLVGCGPGMAQTVVSGQASVIVGTQPARFSAYEQMHARCLEASVDLDAYRECMRPARAVAVAADGYRDSLTTAQRVIDASGGDSAAALSAIACAIAAAGRFVEELEPAGVPIPREVAQVAAMVPEGVCGE